VSWRAFAARGACEAIPDCTPRRPAQVRTLKPGQKLPKGAVVLSKSAASAADATAGVRQGKASEAAHSHSVRRVHAEAGRGEARGGLKTQGKIKQQKLMFERTTGVRVVHLYLCACIHTCTHMHAHMGVCTHACMYACTHTYMHAYVHACICACMHMCMHAYVHGYLVRTHIDAFMHRYMHAYAHIHTYMHSYVGTCMHTRTYTYMHSYIGTNMHICMHACHMHTYMHSYTGMNAWYPTHIHLKPKCWLAEQSQHNVTVGNPKP